MIAKASCSQQIRKKCHLGLFYSLIGLFFLALTLNLKAKTQQMTSETFEDCVFADHIHTVMLFPSHNKLAFPAIRLRSAEFLEFHFDDLRAGSQALNYTLVHCNADWTASGLLASEYLQGYQNFFLRDFEYSFNTFIPYTHYSLDIPNEDVKFKISGNYVLIVYDESPDKPLITRRFVVFEDVVIVNATVRRPTNVDYIDTHQELDFTINHSGYLIADPFSDLKVHVLQNQSWSTVNSKLRPRFVQNQMLDYNYEKENLFPAGNEYRNFDTKDERNLSMNVRRIELDTNFIYFLAVDEARSISRYTTWDDVNGQRVIRYVGSDNEHTRADYVWVDFYLNVPELTSDEKVFIYGALSDFQLKDRYKLNYHKEEKAYRAKILLKQGFYNYMYALEGTGSESVDFSYTEGNRWETENNYQILVYNREIGLRYDRAIAFVQVSSADLY